MPVRSLSAWSLAWRVAAAVLGIGLLLNASLRMSDDTWPLGPMSQYAFFPPADDVVKVTRVEGRLADGRRLDLPLRSGESGISRAEIEDRIPKIQLDPTLLRGVADSWMRQHPAEPRLQQVWLVQDETQLLRGHVQSVRRVELATWLVTG